MLYDEAPVWFFNYNKAVLAYQPWIHGLQANPTEITHQYTEDIWVDEQVAGEVTELTPLMFLSPLGERLGEGASEGCLCITPSPNLSPKGERSMMLEARPVI